MSTNTAGQKVPTVRLNRWKRSRISDALLHHAYDKADAQLAEAEDQLFKRCLIHLVGGEKVWSRMIALPLGWLNTSESLQVYAAGWTVRLSASQPLLRPAFLHEHEARTLKDPALIASAQEHSQASDRHREAKKTLRHQIDSMLFGCSTLAGFFRIMPEAEPIVGKVIVSPTPSSALVTTGHEVMCCIAQARGEARDGCEQAEG